jgi:hypothetical protein
VLTYLRNVFRDQQTDRGGVGHGPTISRRGGSSPPPRYQDGPFVMGGPIGIQVVVARHDLDVQPGSLGHGAQIVGVEQPQPILRTHRRGAALVPSS